MVAEQSNSFMIRASFGEQLAGILNYATFDPQENQAPGATRIRAGLRAGEWLQAFRVLYFLPMISCQG
jgi:hypothetical protein